MCHLYSIHSGPPLTLAGDPLKKLTTDVELYELFRDRRRDKVGLTLSARQRTEILLNAGYTEKMILDAVETVQRCRYERYVSAQFDPEPSASHRHKFANVRPDETENKCVAIDSIALPHMLASAAPVKS
jgi:hypothetical protein